VTAAVTGVVVNQEIDALLDVLVTAEGQQDPYPIYQQLRTMAPVAMAPDGALVLTRYADCDALLRNPQCGHGAVAVAGLPTGHPAMSTSSCSP
jgi:cytochrome P450